MYVITDWIQTKRNGKIPDLPKKSGYSLLFDTGVESTFALFECDYIDNEKILDGMEVISGEISVLIDSAKNFPPIIAIVKEKIKSRLDNKSSRLQFVKTLRKTIRETLQQYKPGDFLFEKASKTETGYLDKGVYCWIVGYNEKENLVKWVSGDFFIYCNPIEYFTQSKELIRKHFKNSN
jgi:hypothetical protein